MENKGVKYKRPTKVFGRRLIYGGFWEWAEAVEDLVGDTRSVPSSTLLSWYCRGLSPYEASEKIREVAL